MDLRVYEADAIATPPSAPVSPSTGYPTNGNPLAAQNATETGDYWFYQLSEEMRAVVLEGGLTPDHTSLTQLRDAIKNIVKGGDYKASVRVASTAAINLAAPGANIDGVAMVAGDRFLEKDNATAADRGIYIWNGAAVPATRALDADTGAEFNGGAIIPVEEGTANADTNWQVTNDGVVTIGTTGLTFKEVAAQNFATNAEAQAFVVTNKAISPATLAAALQGANQSLVTSGYQKLPGGFILQWARPILAPNGFVTVTFPITFPNQALHIVASNSDGTASLYSIEAHVVSTSQAQIYQNSSTNRGVTYFVIGN